MRWGLKTPRRAGVGHRRCGGVRPIYQSISQSNAPEGCERVEAYASALSRLSLKTPVTERSMSKLSVASVRIFCAAWVAAPAVGGTPPALRAWACVRSEEGEVAREAGRECGEGPASPGP